MNVPIAQLHLHDGRDNRANTWNLLCCCIGSFSSWHCNCLALILGPWRKKILSVEPWAFCRLQKFSCKVFLNEGCFEVPILILTQEWLEDEPAQYHFVFLISVPLGPPPYRDWEAHINAGSTALGLWVLVILVLVLTGFRIWHRHFLKTWIRVIKGKLWSWCYFCCCSLFCSV